MLAHQIIKVSLASSLFLGTLSVGYAQACDYVEDVPASRETRDFQNTEIGFSFKIPANYRAMGININTSTANPGRGILILNPSTYDYIQCSIRNNLHGDSPQESAAIHMLPVRSSQKTLYTLVIENYPHMADEGMNFNYATLAGRPVLAYSQLDIVYDMTINYAALLSLDGRHLIVISGPAGESVFNLVISSFQLQ